MKQLDDKQTKEISLNILKDIASFCDNNNIKYYLTCGTLLGAIRHHGFIPWDDDVDIIMPRGDYERFLNTYNGKYSLCKPSSGMFYYAKVYDPSTVKYEKNLDYKKYKPLGVDIDVFPVDGIVNDEKVIKDKLKKIKALETLLLLSNEPIFYRKNPLKAINRIVPRIIGSKNIVAMIEKLAKEYKYDDSEYVIRFRNTRNGNDTAYKKTVLEPACKVSFEGYEFNAPNDYDAWLRLFYGDDYNELPPVDKRRSSHNNKCYRIED